MEPVKQTSEYYRKVLARELHKRRAKNPSYSLRAFAHAVAVDAGTISRILRGEQVPTYRMAARLAPKLNLTAEEEIHFFESTSEKSNNLRPGRRPGGRRLKNLDVDAYDLIADWYHMAIMELTFTKNFQYKKEEVARSLGISIEEVEQAVKNLQLTSLVEFQGEKLVKKESQLTTSRKHITTQALRKNQKQFLLKAIDSLENDPLSERTVTSMTMAIDPERLTIAKKMIHDFNQALSLLLEGGEQSRVYNLSVALYPLQKREPKL